jgi:hypothetical protein
MFITVPALLLACLIAALYGTLYHLWRGGGVQRLLLYLVLSVAGFTAGHVIGVWRNWVFLPLGVLNLGLSSAGSLLFLLVGDWFIREETTQQ